MTLTTAPGKDAPAKSTGRYALGKCGGCRCPGVMTPSGALAINDEDEADDEDGAEGSMA
jgi:hypothetical protein